MNESLDPIEVLLFGGLRAFAPSGKIVLDAAALRAGVRPGITASDIKRAVGRHLAPRGDDAAAWVDSSRLATECRVLADDEAVVLKAGLSLALLPPVNGG